MNIQPSTWFTGGLGRRAKAGITAFAMGRRGSLFLETVIALATFILVGVAVLGGVSTTFISGANTENQSIAENIARNQLEAIAAQPFQVDSADYTLVATPDGYQVVVTSEQLMTELTFEIQTLIITVSLDVGEEILRLETIKANL